MTKITLLLITAFLFCLPQDDNLLEGKWTMYKVIQDGKDVSEEHNPFGERYFQINADGTFESGGRPYGSNTGKYVYNTETNHLFLDSDVGPNDDSNWNITLNADTLLMQGTGTAWAERFQMILMKEKS